MGPGAGGGGVAGEFAPRTLRQRGIDSYQTNQTSRITFHAPQSATPAKVPLPQQAAAPSDECRPSAVKCRPLEHVPPLNWVPLRVRCRPPEREFDQLFSRVDAPGYRPERVHSRPGDFLCLVMPIVIQAGRDPIWCGGPQFRTMRAPPPISGKSRDGFKVNKEPHQRDYLPCLSGREQIYTY